MKNRIRELREERGMTQEQLGEMIGTSRQAINAIETEKFEPSIWIAYDLSQVFGCSIEEIFLFDESQRRSRADCSRGAAMAIRNLRYHDSAVLRKMQRGKSVDDRIHTILLVMLGTLRHTKNGGGIPAKQICILKRAGSF